MLHLQSTSSQRWLAQVDQSLDEILIDHVQHASNFGAGIYVSYFFTLLWTIDALAWWIIPTRFASRPSWLGYAIHGFMLFIVFNATLVFESGAIRWFGAAILLSLLAACLTRQYVIRVSGSC